MIAVLGLRTEILNASTEEVKIISKVFRLPPHGKFSMFLFRFLKTDDI